MDFSLTTDQEQVIATVDRWVARSWRSGAAESVAFRRTRWLELVANGWTGLLTPGDTAALLDAALIVENLAYGGCSLPVGSGGMVAPFVAAAVGLPPAESGRVDQLVVAGGSPARGLEVADRAIVLAPGDPFAVSAVELRPSDVTVVADEGPTVLARLGNPSLGKPALRPLDPDAAVFVGVAGAVLSAAELVGLGRAVLDGCVDYAKLRVQGGKPIGGHQAIQHRLVDMLAGVERARYLTYAAAVGQDDTLAKQAKALAARDSLAAIRSGHQVLGAISYSAEHWLHHLHKQAVAAASEFGGTAQHLADLAARDDPAK